MYSMDKKTEEGTLTGRDAVAKMQELVKHNAVCMFTSNVGEVPLQTRPMTTQEVDDEGNFWFLSSKDSHKNHQVSEDARVQLIYANTSESEFLTVYGRASVLDDRQKIEEMWSPMAKAWFEKGKDDPDLSLLRVTPEEVYYWEPRHNKMITLTKMAAAAMTGERREIGREGKLEI